MRERHVVIVAFDGLQPLDAVGPARGLRRRRAGGRRRSGEPGGYRVTLASTGGGTGPSRERTRPGHRAAARRRASASTPWSSPAGPAPGRPRATRSSWLDPPARRRAAGGWPPCARAPSSAPRPGCSPAAGSPPIGPGPGSWPRRIPTSRSTPIRSTSATGSTGRAPASPPASTSRWRWSRRISASTWPRPWPAGSSCSCTGPGGQTPVRVAGLGPARRALDRPGRADPRRVRPRRRPSAARPRRGGRHERPPLHPGLHGRGGRDPEPLRRAHAPGGRPARARGDRRHARRGGGALRARAAPRPCGACSSATSAWRPTPTGGASAPPPNERTSA